MRLYTYIGLSLVMLFFAVHLCLSALIVRREADSVSSGETSTEEFQRIKNELAKVLTKEQNDRLGGILGRFNSNTSTFEQKLGGLVQLLEMGLEAANATAQKAINNGVSTEPSVAENKI